MEMTVFFDKNKAMTLTYYNNSLIYIGYFIQMYNQ